MMSVQYNSVVISHDLDLAKKLEVNIDNLELDALCTLDPDDVASHPNRAFLLALIGFGNIHRHDVAKGTAMVVDAIRYGLDKEVAAKLLLRGLNISIARSYAALGKDNRAASKLINFYLLGNLGAKVAFDVSMDSLFSGVKRDIAEAGSSIHVRDDQVDKYCIKRFYTSRESYFHYDDSQEEDKWQLEIYLYAYHMMKKHGLSTVLDVGCGSGYKLVKYLGDFNTIGSELNVNLKMLKNRYPERRWVESSFDTSNLIETDLIICSDVIEHLVDPDLLLRWLMRQNSKYIILSTPDRDLVYETGAIGRDGPPNNPAHVREWNFEEFYNYISGSFSVIEHKISNQEQATQMIICKRR